MTNEIQKQTLPDAAELVAAFDGDKGLNVPVGAVLPIVKILRESPKFEMPDGSTTESFRGHIIHYHSVNQLYLEDYGANSAGKKPDCSSCDGLVPCAGYFDIYKIPEEKWPEILAATDGPADLKDVELTHPIAQFYINKYANANPTRSDVEPLRKVESCSTCPAAQFGSRTIGENSKACQNSIWLYILIDGYRIPVFLKAGPSSLNRKESLIPFLSNAPNIGLMGMYQTIDVQFSLFTKKFESGFEASCLKLSDPRVLDTEKPAEVEKINDLIALYRSFKERYLSAMQNFVASDSGAEGRSSDAADGEVSF